MAKHNFKQRLAIVACLSLSVFVLPEIAQGLARLLDPAIHLVNSVILTIGKYLSGW